MSKHKDFSHGLKFLLDSLLKIGYAAVLVLLTIVLCFAFGYMREGGGFYAIVSGAYVFFYLLFLPALILLIGDKRVSIALRVVGYAWVAIVIFLMVVLGYGLLKDSLGAYCTGFFSAPTSCASNQYLIALVLFFNPYSILGWMGLSILGLLKGWYDYFEDRSRARRHR